MGHEIWLSSLVSFSLSLASVIGPYYMVNRFWGIVVVGDIRLTLCFVVIQQSLMPRYVHSEIHALIHGGNQVLNNLEIFCINMPCIVYLYYGQQIDIHCTFVHILWDHLNSQVPIFVYCGFFLLICGDVIFWMCWLSVSFRK